MNHDLILNSVKIIVRDWDRITNHGSSMESQMEFKKRANTEVVAPLQLTI